MCSVPWIYGRAAGKDRAHNELVLMWWLFMKFMYPWWLALVHLIISTPVTYMVGLAASRQKGFLIKGGAHLEYLALVH